MAPEGGRTFVNYLTILERHHSKQGHSSDLKKHVLFSDILQFLKGKVLKKISLVFFKAVWPKGNMGLAQETPRPMGPRGEG